MEKLIGQSAKPEEDFQPNGVLREGFLEKRSKYIKSWRKRYVILTKTHLITHKYQHGWWETVTESITLNYNCKVQSGDNEIFKVMAQERTFYFKSADSSNKQAWIGALEKVMTRPTDKVDNNIEGVENTSKNIPE